MTLRNPPTVTGFKKAVFLDRDGTLNEDPGYLNDPSLLQLFSDVGQALQILKKNEYSLIIVTNQSGVGRGLIQKETLVQIHHRLDELLKPWDITIDAYGICFHRPEENCQCRKPKPQLLLDSAQKLNIKLSESFMVGDKLSDIQAGKAAGCRGTILVRTGSGKLESVRKASQQADFIADSLLEAAHWIVNLKTEDPEAASDQIQENDKQKMLP